MLKARFGDAPSRKHYTPMQRLQILWHMAYYGIPRSKVTEHFLIARSTFYRWLHAAERGDLGEKKTQMEQLGDSHLFSCATTDLRPAQLVGLGPPPQKLFPYKFYRPSPRLPHSLLCATISESGARSSVG